jgi:hypothetical protein
MWEQIQKEKETAWVKFTSARNEEFVALSVQGDQVPSRRIVSIGVARNWLEIMYLRIISQIQMVQAREKTLDTMLGLREN